MFFNIKNTKKEVQYNLFFVLAIKVLPLHPFFLSFCIKKQKYAIELT